MYHLPNGTHIWVEEGEGEIERREEGEEWRDRERERKEERIEMGEEWGNGGRERRGR